MRQNILYCGKSYSFHRYCRQKILRLVLVFAVLAARGVRMFFFFFSVHFDRCNCISITVCYFIEKYSCNSIFFCKYLLIGFKVVEKSIRPMAGDCKKKVSAQCFKAIKKCPPHGLLHRPLAPNKYGPVPKRLKDHTCIIDQTYRTRVDKKRIEKKHTKPDLLQVNMPLRQCYIHQQPPKITRKYAFMDISGTNIKLLTRMFCYSSHKIATANKN